MKIGSTPLSLMNFFHSLLLAGVLSIQTDLFVRQEHAIYNFLLQAAPQSVYTGISLGIALLFAVSFVFKRRHLEIIALLLSGSYLLFILAGYASIFPNMASVIYSIWMLATFMSVVDILYLIEDDKKNDQLKERKEFYK